jgi:uncharacterized protein DUF3558
VAAGVVVTGAHLDPGLMRAAAVAALTVLGLLALLGLSACSSDGTPSAGASPDASDVAAVGWSPCDDLTAASVTTVVGAAVHENDGTTDSPRCTFTPVRTGGAAYDVSYLWFDGGLDAALDAMGATGAQLEAVDVEGADAARLVVDASKSGVLVTGFVQTKGLVQSVNAAQLAPYDKAAVVAGTQALLAALAEHAPAAPKG